MSIIQMLAAGPYLTGGVPEFIGATAFGDDRSFSVDYPPGIVAGDLIIAVGTSKETSNNFSMDATGYTVVDSLSYAHLATRIADGTESGGSLATNSTNKQCGAVIFVLRNSSPTLIDWDLVMEDNADAPSSVATAAGQIHLIGATGNEDNFVTPAGYSTAATYVDNGAAHGCWRILDSSGATGIQEVTNGGNATGAWSIIVGAA